MFRVLVQHSNFAAAIVNGQSGRDHKAVGTMRMRSHHQAANNAPAMQRDIVKPKFVDEAPLIAVKVAFGKELASVKITAAKGGDLARRAVAFMYARVVGIRVLRICLHALLLHRIRASTPRRGRGLKPSALASRSAWEGASTES